MPTESPQGELIEECPPKSGLLSKAKEAVGTAAGTAASKAGEVAQTAKTKVGEAAGTAADAAKDKLGGAATTAAGAATGAASTVAGAAGNAASTAAGVAASKATAAANVASAKVDAAKQAAYDALPPEERQLLMAAREVMDVGKEKAKNKVLNGTMPLGGKVLDLIKASVIETATDDADMPAPVTRSLRWLIDGIFHDLKVEARKGLRDQALKKAEDDQTDVQKPCICTPWGFRAFFLHHFLPYDRSIWGKIRDPVFLIFSLIILFPRFAVRQTFFAFLLFLITVPWPPDEYQLTNFILRFKGTQFITGGVLASLGTMLEMETCERRGWLCPALGPKPFIFQLAELLGNVVLVWVAFLLLPFSKKYGLSKFVAENHLVEERSEKSREMQLCCCFGVKVHEDRGGRLAYLLRYDAFAVAFCMAVFGFLCWLWESPEMSMFWAETAYGYLSFPFALFMLPGLDRVLTHTEPTGFNEAGKCVELKIRSLKDSKDNGSDARVMPV